MKIKLSDISENRLTEEQQKALQKYFNDGGTWQELLELGTNDLEEVYAVGYKAYQERDYEKALASFAALIQLNPYETKHWIAIGAALQGKEAYADAISAYTLALSLDEGQITPLYYSAQCAHKLGNHFECRDYLEQVIARDQSSPLAQKAQLIIETLTEEECA